MCSQNCYHIYSFVFGFTVDSYRDDSLKLIEKYLNCHHPLLRVLSPSKKGKHRTPHGADPLNFIPSPSYDDAALPAERDFAMTRLTTYAHPSLGSLAPKGVFYDTFTNLTV